MKICPRNFDASQCEFQQDTKKPIEDQIRFCQNLKCPHGTILEKKLSSGEWVAFVSCDLTWNPFDCRPTTEAERELMM